MKILRIITGLTLVFCLLFTVFIGKNKILESEVNDKPQEYKGILTMWQIDGFEGGTGSRKQFLLKVARGFEKANDGVLIMVTTQTLKGAAESLEQDKIPDIISYSNGTDILKFLTKINVDRSISSCQIANKTYGTAWCRGGYVLISNPNLTEEIFPKTKIENLLVSKSEYTQPLTALSFENIEVGKIEEKEPMDAYIRFVSGKTPYFLGTQRDLVRLNNRGMSYNAYPLKEFNDLYQYVSVTSTNQLKKVYAEKFVDYLVSDKVQYKLSEIKMFSEYVNVEYDEEIYKDMQSIKNFKSLSAFTSQIELKELERISALYLSGQSEYINKIKNMLV